MKRGEVWTIAGGADYAGKPRPALIIQHNPFTTEDSVTLIPITSDDTGIGVLRIQLAANRANGLRHASMLMVDKITTVRRSKMGRRLGMVTDSDLAVVESALVTFLGLAE